MEVDWECTINVNAADSVAHVVDNSQTSDIMILGTGTLSNGLGNKDMFAVFLDWQGNAKHAVALGEIGNVADYAKMGIETHDNGYLILGNNQ